MPATPADSDSRVPQWPSDSTLWKDTPVVAPLPVSVPSVASTIGASRPRALEDVISASLPAVALVETPGGRGTGFFVAPDTLITNSHVVEGNSYVTIKLSNGETISGRVTQRSDDLDLAAIRTNDTRPGQAILPLASSREARIGGEVIAIGSPLGLQNTVTRGIVSALRQVGAVVLVQTDAAINPGNSGGPLLDRSGRVLAVTTMRMTGRAEALGFGVGAEHVRAMLDGRAPQSAQGQRPADLFAPGRPEGADGQRETGEAMYERILVEAAKRADQLDASWTDFVADCMEVKRRPLAAIADGMPCGNGSTTRRSRRRARGSSRTSKWRRESSNAACRRPRIGRGPPASTPASAVNSGSDTGSIPPTGKPSPATLSQEIRSSKSTSQETRSPGDLLG